MARLNYKEVLKGDTGYTFEPHVTKDGFLYWTNDGNLENPLPVNIHGEKGEVYTPIIDEECNLSWTNNGNLENPKSVNIRGKQGYHYTPHVNEDGILTWTNDGDLSNPMDFNIKDLMINEVKDARTDLDGYTFDKINDRLDSDNKRIINSIENKFKKINYLDNPSKIIINGRFVRHALDGEKNAIWVEHDGNEVIHFYKIDKSQKYFFNVISTGLSKVAFFENLNEKSGIMYFENLVSNWNQEITSPQNANYIALVYDANLKSSMFLGKHADLSLFETYKKNTELNENILVRDLEERVLNLESEYITIGKNGNFKTIKEGFEYAIKNDMKVKIESGVYDLVKEGISGKGYFAPKEIWGYGVTLICELEEENWELSPINISMDSEESKIYGLTIICNNCRYCIHDDMGGQMVGDIKIPFYHNVYKDLKLVHKSPQSSILKAPQCIGGGLGDYGFIEIDNCVFESEIYADVSYHSKSWSPQTPQSNNCIVTCKDTVFKSTFSISAIGDDTNYMNTIYISNCLMKTLPDKRERTNIKFIEWNNVKIV